VQGTQRFSFRLAVNEHFPLHTGAPGKAIVAFLPFRQQNDIVNRMVLTKFNARTLSTKKALLAELSRIRKRGYATDTAEEVEGCHCVSAPILDRDGYPLAAVWVTAPSSRLPARMFESAAPAVITAARNIAGALQSAPDAGVSFMKLIVEKAVQYIHGHLDEDFFAEQLAAELNVGYSSFRHWFKRVHGIGPAQYHLRQRMDAAKKLLSTSRRTIASVCRTLGYEDQNYFSALFKKKTGMSPLAYRDKAKSRRR